ncbi:hypothetical protein HWHPT5561_06875 [Petrotoga sp. HWH.PT.55.6.1]|nr:hypothetical protein X926_01070 [Petrotoga sp. HWHPT.55.6.3]RPD35539.1 hypothetical protein HWHPT5561_06875 [Petrotoga sp. HWH.PT.55.6.1]
MIDWSVVPDFNNKMGRTGYSRRALLKAIFVQKIKDFTVRELIHFLKSNPFSMFLSSPWFPLLAAMTRIMLWSF